jgi:Fe-Mn family superoxide dismutase
MFNLHRLRGISDRTVGKHMALYEKYANATNELNEHIFDLVKDGKVDHEERPAYSQLTRRLGFGKKILSI